jgi:hypothetical protein
LEPHLSAWHWRPVIHERVHADLHDVLHVWSLDTLLAAHRLCDAIDASQPPPPPVKR